MGRIQFLLIALLLFSASFGQILNSPYAHQVVTAETPDALGVDAIFYFDPSRSESLYEEISASFNANNAIGVPLNRADTDNDLVGLLYDLSNNAMYMTHTSSSSTRPTLTSDGTRSSYLNFTGSQGLILQNSTVILRPAHQVSSSTTWEIAIWAKKSVDGTSMTLYTNSDGATNQRGIFLGTTTGNAINARLGDGDGTLMVSITSTATWTVVDGWTVIRFWRNGSTCGIQIGNNTAQTAAVSGGVTNSASGDFRIGSSSAGNGFNGGIAQLLMLNRLFTAGEVTDFKAFNPSRSNARFRLLARRYDFTDITTQYSDASATVPASVNGQVAAITNDKTSNFGPYPLSLQQGTSANQGIHRSNVVNGQSALEFDGSNDFYNVLNSTVRAGSGTWYFVYINQDTDLNSNIADANYPAYVASTGENYLDPSPYVAWHFDVGDVNESVSIANIPNAGTITIIALRMYGGTRTIFNYSGESSEITTSDLQWAPVAFGRAANGDASLYHDGYAFIYEFWHGHETNSEVISHMQELGAQFGL